MSVEKFVALIIIPIFLILFFAFLMMSGPRNIDFSSNELLPEALEIPKDVEASLAKSLELEAKFEEILSYGKITIDNIGLLVEAIDSQEAYLNGLPYHSESAKQRLNYLKQRYDQVMSDDLYLLSTEKEKESKNSLNNKDYPGAMLAIKEAIVLQKKINEVYPLSSYFDINRLTVLNRQLDYLNAYPIYNEILDLEAQVNLLVESKSWLEAADIVARIMEKQLYLNSEYRSSDLADNIKLNSLRLKRVRYLSAPLYDKIRNFEIEAEKLIEKREFSVAAELYKKALNIQDELNKSFPESVYSSNDKANELLRKKESAASYELGELLNTLNFKIDKDLRERKVMQAKDKIVKIADALERMDREFPLSSYNDGGLRVKIKFLNYIRNDIELIQDRVYESIVPVPGEPGIKMLKTEVSQAFYSTIIGFNPSRFVGNEMPVESVNWIEAREFCRRLSWIMGLRVRLPKEYEFRAAIGSLRYVKIEKFVVSNAEEKKLSKIASKQPLGEGFYDLLGNVSEWLFTDGVFENEPVKHIGGHFNDRLNTIYSVPVRVVNRNERSRLIGFRFIVE